MSRSSSRSLPAPSAQPRRCTTLLAAVTAIGLGACSDGEETTGAGGGPGAEPTIARIADGEDYSLPSWVEAEPYSGYGSGQPNERILQKNWHVKWRDLEPVRGQYAWNVVEDALADARDGGYQLNMHLTSIVLEGGNPDLGITVSSSVPDWVMNELNPPTDTLGWLFDLRVIPGWRPDIRDAFNALVREFGNQGYPQREEIGAAYIHGISLSRGEEFWMDEPTATQLEGSLGFSRQACTDWIESRIDAYADAFAGATHKLVWVGGSESFRFGDYQEMAWELVQVGWDRGCGTRGGIVERYHTKANDRSFGQQVDPDGYLTVDETIPPIATVRYFGEENEEYGESWEWRYGSIDGEALRYRLAILRALQMRVRFLWTSDAAEVINPPLSEYARLSFGKQPATSPDAWVYLKESPVRFSPNVVRNFERWILQRDVPTGMTVPAQRVEREFDASSSPDGQWYDDLARRTDVTSDNPYIFFFVDDGFVVDAAVDVHVEIWDETAARWRLEYNSVTVPDQATPWVDGQGDSAVRTVVFTLPDAAFRNALDHEADLRIHCEGPDDVLVRWLRVVRHALPVAPAAGQ
jgi:hypothetical protein